MSLSQPHFPAWWGEILRANIGGCHVTASWNAHRIRQKFVPSAACAGLTRRRPLFALAAPLSGSPSPRKIVAPAASAVDARSNLASGCRPHDAARPFPFALVAFVVGLTPDFGRFGLNLSGVLDLAGRSPSLGPCHPVFPRSPGCLQNTPAECPNGFNHASVVSRADPYSARNGGHDQPRPAYISANS